MTGPTVRYLVKFFTEETTMKRIQYHHYGDPEEMHLETYELPAPGKDEIRVRIKAASVNPLDWKLRQGAMKFMTGRRLPRAMGSDFSGVVISVGSNVTRFCVGDEVIGTTPIKPSGAFAEELITKEKLVIKKPASLTFEAASALPTIGVTAWRALILKAHLKPGQSVFINAALGGVGQAAMNIAKSFGASVAGRVGPGAITEATALGIDPVLDYTKDIPASLKQKFDIVFDCNGSLTPGQEDALAKRGGIILDINPTAKKFMRSLFSRRHKFVMGSPRTEILQKIVDLAAAGKFPITIGRTAPLEESIALIGDLEAGRRVKGKAIIVMP
jgi:NADPH:quinone reductase-like Zn-dependent oxidoreductase